MSYSKQSFDIDLVYLWVDGNDPVWAEKKSKALGTYNNSNTEALSKARNMDNGELMYSLRSVEKNVPWIRKIFIITDEQIPKWLNLNNDKVSIIDIRELVPKESLPCYNSVVIEHCLWKIPGLSEHFLYANDDMFFNAKLTPDFFFTKEGLPVVRLTRAFLGKFTVSLRLKLNIHLNVYRKTIHNAALLIEKKFGKYFSSTPHHNVDAYLKSDYTQVSNVVFKDEISKTLTNHVRSENDIQRIIYLYYALAAKRGKLRFVGRNESCRIRLHKPDFNYFIDKYNPSLFCLNDSHHSTDDDRARVTPFLSALFPDKSSFEL